MIRDYMYFADKEFKGLVATKQYNLDLDVGVIHAQQFLEKGLKQLVLLQTGEEFKTHKLAFLADKTGIDELKPFKNILRQIQEYYFDKRYPSETYMETTDDEFEEVYNACVDIKKILDKWYNDLSNINKNKTTKQMDVFNNIK